MKSVMALLSILLLCSGSIATPPPISKCPPGITLAGSSCRFLAFNFSHCFSSDDSLSYHLIQGPGAIDTVTGVWQWTDVSVADSGNHYVVVAAWVMNGGSQAGTSTTLGVVVQPPTALDISSGCSTDVLLTDQTKTVQMGTATACDDNVWTMTQFKGPATGATCTIDQTGLITFEATQPSLYEYRAVVTNGIAKDSCLHTFVVHGGAGCCVGMRGNIDGVGGVDLSDLSLMVSYMYNALTSLPCMDEANVSGTGIVDLTDLSTLILYLTVPGSVTLANCP